MSSSDEIVSIIVKPGKVPEDDEQFSLLKRQKEKERRHAAFLAYVCQDPELRSQRMLAKLWGVTDKTIRNWKNWHDWDDRISLAGAGAQQIGLRMLHRLYPEVAEECGPEIEKRMSIPFKAGFLPDKDRERRAKAEAAQQRADGDPDYRSDGAATGPLGRARLGQELNKNEEGRRYLDRAMLLIDATLAHAGKKLKDGTLRVNARDIPVLIRARHEVEALSEGHTGMHSGAVPPSVRVTEAERKGESVLDALAADAEEAVAVLRALQTQAEVDAQVAAQRREMLRDGSPVQAAED